MSLIAAIRDYRDINGQTLDPGILKYALMNAHEFSSMTPGMLKQWISSAETYTRRMHRLNGNLMPQPRRKLIYAKRTKQYRLQFKYYSNTNHKNAFTLRDLDYITYYHPVDIQRDIKSLHIENMENNLKATISYIGSSHQRMLFTAQAIFWNYGVRGINADLMNMDIDK